MSSRVTTTAIRLSMEVRRLLLVPPQPRDIVSSDDVLFEFKADWRPSLFFARVGLRDCCSNGNFSTRPRVSNISRRQVDSTALLESVADHTYRTRHDGDLHGSQLFC